MAGLSTYTNNNQSRPRNGGEVTSSSGSVSRNTGTGLEPTLIEGGARDAMAYGNQFPQGMVENPPASSSSVDDFSEYSFISPQLGAQIKSFYDNPNIAQARKDAFRSAFGGLTSSLPTQSTFDRWSEAIIGTSNYQKAMNKLGTDIGSLLAQYNVTDYQEKYNSAQEQSSRLQNAGVNPDMQGASVDAGSSSDFDDQATGATSPSTVYPDYNGSTAISTIMQVVSGVFNWSSAIQGLIRNDIELSVAETSERSSEIDYIQKLAHSSNLYPDSSVTFPEVVHSDGYNEDVSLYDKNGNLIPYSKLNAKQLDAVKSYMEQHNINQLKGIYSNYFVDDSFSENKKRRMKQRLYDYVSSEQFRRKWYEDHRSLVSNRLASAKDSSDPMYNSVDSLLEACQKALMRSGYDEKIQENIYNSNVYKNLIEQGVAKEEAEQRARVAIRDKADNLVLDEFRDNLLDLLDPKSEVGRNADKWEKISARLGLLLLFYLRQSVLHNN